LQLLRSVWLPRLILNGHGRDVLKVIIVIE
jgi:hypothetical protein